MVDMEKTEIFTPKEFLPLKKWDQKNHKMLKITLK